MAAEPGHLKVNVGHVGAQAQEPLERLLAVGRLARQLHVRRDLDRRRDPLAHEGMVVHDQDAD